MDKPSLVGPAVVPPGATHAPTRALILLHGFGASGDDLIGLHAPLKSALSQLHVSGRANVAETFALFCPHAPSPTPFHEGRQWFKDAGWTFTDPAGQAATHARLEAFVDDLATTHGIPRSNIILGGFSQGGMQVLYTLPRLNPGVAGGMTLAGALCPAPEPSPASIVPLLMLHGTADDVLPADRTLAAADAFSKLGYAPEVQLLDGLPHGIDARCILHMADFMGRVWGPA